MKNFKEIKSSKAKKGNEFEPKRDGYSTKEKSSPWPEEHEEQRSTDIRMKPQPYQLSSKQEKKKQKADPLKK